jgi:hypothetical protein
MRLYTCFGIFLASLFKRLELICYLSVLAIRLYFIAPAERSMQGLKFLTGVADTVIKVARSLGLYRKEKLNE